MSDSEEISPEALLRLAQSGSQDRITAYFQDDKHGDVLNYQDVTGNTVLHFAVRHGWEDTVDLLTTHDAGCDLDLVNLHSDTPISLAVKLDDEDARRSILRTLILAGASTEGVLNRVSPDVLQEIRDYEQERDEAEAEEEEEEDARPAFDMEDVASDDEGPGGSGSDSE
ncbi:hypothetical protein BV22DRAFT_1032430, partial [Leucogyrophana mollusca]